MTLDREMLEFADSLMQVWQIWGPGLHDDENYLAVLNEAEFLRARQVNSERAMLLYVKTFVPDYQELMSEGGFCFSSLDAALEYCETATPKINLGWVEHRWRQYLNDDPEMDSYLTVCFGHDLRHYRTRLSGLE